MLAKKYRFHGHGSLKYLFQNGANQRSRYFAVRVLHNPRRNKSRFSVIVSKKIHKSAVGRNRIRRRMYELLRAQHPDFANSFDIAVIITNAEAIAAPHDDLKKSLQDSLARSGVYKTP